MGPLLLSMLPTPITASAQYICSCRIPSLCHNVLCSHGRPSCVFLPDRDPDSDPLPTQPVLDLIQLGVLWCLDLPASALNQPPSNATSFVLDHWSLAFAGFGMPDIVPLDIRSSTLSTPTLSRAVCFNKAISNCTTLFVLHLGLPSTVTAAAAAAASTTDDKWTPAGQVWVNLMTGNSRRFCYFWVEF